MKHGGEPAVELHGQRIVEAKLGADAGDLFGGCVVAGDDRRRIAGREMKQEEHEYGDDAHHENRRGQPPGNIGEHLAAGSALLPSPLRGGVGGGGLFCKRRIDCRQHATDFGHHFAIGES